MVTSWVHGLLWPRGDSGRAEAHGKARGGKASKIVYDARDRAAIRHYDDAGRLIQVIQEHPRVVFTWEYTAE
jgi:hypothetical protein